MKIFPLKNLLASYTVYYLNLHKNVAIQYCEIYSYQFPLLQ